MDEIDDLLTLAKSCVKRKAAKKTTTKKPKLDKETDHVELIVSDAILDKPCASNEIAFVFPCRSDPNGPALTGATRGMLYNMLRGSEVNIDTISQYYVIGDYVSFNNLTKAFKLSQIDYWVDRIKAQLALKGYKVIVLFGIHVMKKFIKGASSLDDERGAPSVQPWGLTIPTYHPKDCFIDFSLSLVSELDLAKAVRLSKNGWTEKPISIIHSPNFFDCCAFLDRLAKHEGKPIACDIETTMKTLVLTCIGFASGSNNAFVIPWSNHGHPHWSPTEEMILLRKLDIALTKCKLIGHNAVHFDHYALAIRYKINANFTEDTMLLHWEMHPELPKSLGFVNAFYTDNPYWKSMLAKARSGELPYYAERIYNGKDNANTYECFEAMLSNSKNGDFHKEALTHYRFNVECARVLNYMSLHGAYLNTTLLNDKMVELHNKEYLLNRDLSIVAGRELNVTSPAQMKKYLYDELKLPAKFKSALTAEGDYEDRETADYLTTLLLEREFPTYKQLSLIAALRKLRKRMSSLGTIKTRKNGIVGWGFNIVGTTTGRLSSYKPADQEGVQAQNVDRNDRDLFSFNPVTITDQFRSVNDQGEVVYKYPENIKDYPSDFIMWLKADLEGADSWTVGAMLSAIGEQTLIEDLRAGLKPAQVLALSMLLKDNAVMSYTQDKLLSMKKLLKSEEGKEAYRIAKAVNHGSAYMMAERTMHLNIFKYSAGDIWVPPAQCKELQALLFRRYNYPKLHEVMRSYMNSRSYMDMPYGHRHYFYGRKDNSTLRAMLASQPQYNTTVTANVVLHRLYYGPDNRKGTQGDLYLRPANQVHDETDCAFLLCDLDKVKAVWEANKMVPLEVMGVKFNIPFEASFGPTWGHQPFDL